MKKLFLLLALMGMVVVGCSKDEVDKGNDNDIPENIFFGLDKESITISPYGGSVDVVVYSNYKWEISGASDWCTPSVKKGDANEDGQKVTFSADMAYDDREATFWFRCADEKIKFVVSQKSNNAIIYYTSSNSKIVQPNDSSAFGATIISNTYKDGVGVIEFDVPITTIGNSAFYYCSSLTSVTIPDSVTTIGDSAFYNCSSLTSVTIPDSVTEIGYRVFEHCDSLTSVTIGDSVTEIGKRAFLGCSSLTSVTIGDSVTTIGNYAFYYCDSLTSVTIPDSVTTIGDDAFYDCRSLTSVYISDISAWCNISFSGSYSNPLLYAHNLYLNNELVTDLTIPDSVTTIGEDAFRNCESLTSVTIPDSVTSIGGSAFEACSSLTSVTIGDNLTEIGGDAFAYCTSLISVTIPDSVTTIGVAAFYYCSSLTSVTIPDSVTTIGDGAFYYCSSLTSVTIPDSVTTIEDATFAYCSSLRSVTIPDSVTTIGTGAFLGCSSITSVYCKVVTPPTGGAYMFNWNASGRKIYVPMESVEAYKSAEYWSNYADSIVGYNF